jgi:predicted AAA+ superfamily ATPase
LAKPPSSSKWFPNSLPRALVPGRSSASSSTTCPRSRKSKPAKNPFFAWWNTEVGPQRINRYIDFLDSSLLIRAIQPLEIRFKKRKSYSKLCLCDHGLRAAWLQEIIPLDPAALDRQPQLSDLAVHVAESVAGYYLASLTGLDLAHKPEYQGEPEVDYIITIGEKRIPVEIKYRRVIDPLSDTLGLRLFMEKAANNAPFGLLVTRDDQVTMTDPRIICLPLKSLLMVR